MKNRLTAELYHGDAEFSATLTAGTRIFGLGQLIQGLQRVGTADHSHVNGEQLGNDIPKPSLPLVGFFASVSVFARLRSSRIQVDKITLLVQILGYRHGAHL